MVFLFLLCLIGEAAGVFVPYLFESTLLLIGYQASKGIMPIWYVLLLALAAQLGRQVGALALYGFSRSGNTLLMKYKDRFKVKTDLSQALPIKLFRKVNLLSPFSVAVGRLLWLRIPLTLVLGAQGRLKVLMWGVALSTLAYDGTYIILGAITGTTVALEPIRILPYFLAGLTVIYGITFAVRRLIGSINRRREAGIPKIP